MKSNQTVVRIVITGGHLTPAVATISALRRAAPEASIYFIGRKNVFDNDTVGSHEKETIEKLGIPFLPLTTGRLMRAGSFFHIVGSLLKVPIGFLTAFWYLLKIRPNVVVSFGGYIAVPVVLASWIMDIPIVTHEQTRVVGLGTKFIALFASVVCVSDKKHLRSFPFVRVVHTGLPLRDLIVLAAQKKHIHAKKSRPRLLITGGTSGAVSINTVIYQALPHLLPFVDVTHQVGRTSFEQAKEVVANLSAKEKKNYTFVEYLDEKAYLDAVLASDIIIGRSGANTVAELAALGKSAICIPLPWASNNEQYANAKMLEDAGSATIIEQANLTVDTLITAVKAHLAKKSTYERSALALSRAIRLDAGDGLAREILQLI